MITLQKFPQKFRRPGIQHNVITTHAAREPAHSNGYWPMSEIYNISHVTVGQIFMSSTTYPQFYISLQDIFSISKQMRLPTRIQSSISNARTIAFAITYQFDLW